MVWYHYAEHSSLFLEIHCNPHPAVTVPLSKCESSWFIHLQCSFLVKSNAHYSGAFIQRPFKVIYSGALPVLPRLKRAVFRSWNQMISSVSSLGQQEAIFMHRTALYKCLDKQDNRLLMRSTRHMEYNHMYVFYGELIKSRPTDNSDN